MSRIPRRCNNNNNNKTALSPSKQKPANNTKVNNNKKHRAQRSPSSEESDSNLNSVPDGNETVPKTPAGCIAARIRSYSALRRSQWKKNGHVCSDGDKESTPCFPANTMSPLQEISNSLMETEVENNSDLTSDVESDEDVLWKMSRRDIGEKEDTIAHAKVGKTLSKEKYIITVKIKLNTCCFA